MKKTLFLGLLAGFLFDLYATDARVIALGGDNLFYIDEVSIFQNPANIGLYPDLLYGSLGVYRSFGTDSSTSRYHEPSDPFFGGIASLPFTPDTINGNKHSAFFLGGFFNRHDAMLDYLDPHSGRYVGNTGDVMIRPSGAVDLLLGYSWQNGTMIGIGGYAASGSSTVGPVIDSETSLYKLNAGIRAPFGDNGAVEWSAGTGLMRGKGDSAGAGQGPSSLPIMMGFTGAIFESLSRCTTRQPPLFRKRTTVISASTTVRSHSRVFPEASALMFRLPADSSGPGFSTSSRKTATFTTLRPPRTAARSVSVSSTISSATG